MSHRLIRVINWRAVRAARRWFRKRSVTRSEKRLSKQLAKANRARDRVAESLQQSDAVCKLAEIRADMLDAAIVESERTCGKLEQDVRSLRLKVEQLNLTLRQRNDYISTIEQSVARKDTEIGLQKLELESLTLWREKTNQQMRTEADIHAARSRLLQGRTPEKILQGITDGSTSRDG